MAETIIKNVATKISSQDAPNIDRDVAISCNPPFDSIRQLLEQGRPPHRPNRSRPADEIDPELREELDAWDAASDEALERFDGHSLE